MDNNDNSNSGMNVIIGIVAIIAILLVAYFAVQLLNQKQTSDNAPAVNVNLNSSAGAY